MRILHIIDSGGLYGAEIMLLNLGREQLNLGHQVVIASIGSHADSIKPIETAARDWGIQVHTFRMRPGLNLAGARRILRYARASKMDILHSHGYKGNILLGMLPKRIRKVPLVSTLHGWTSTKRLSKITLYEILDRLALCNIDAVVMVNRAMALPPRLKQRLGQHLYVVDNGIAEEEATSGPPRKKLLSFCSRRQTIGAIGRLSAEKGFDILISACQELLKQGTDIQVIIFGEGPERERLENLIAVTPTFADRFQLPGFIHNASRYMGSFALLAMPSLTEGLPITLLEAMRAGTPIVATSVGGIPEIVQHERSALLIPPGQVAPLADSIARLLKNNNLAQQLGREGKKIFLDKFTRKNMAIRYMDIYRQLCTRDSRQL